MNIKLKTGTVCGGKAYPAGAVVEASDKDAHYLIATGAAEECAVPKKKAPAKKKAPTNKMVETEEIETR